MNIKRLLSAAALLLLVSWCVPLSTIAGGEYVIGEGDLLKITVYDNPDLTTDARVSGEGKITFPLIGEVVVGGSTSPEVEKKIAGLLKNGYLVDPQVSVFISEYKNKKVTVLGEFNKPGTVVLRGASSLLEAVSEAGGMTANAGDTLYLRRKAAAGENGKKEGEETVITVNLKALFEEGSASADISVRDGDSIYAPRAAFVYVSGEVKTPGAYKMTDGLTVLKAVTLAGGFTTKANEDDTKIIRKNEKGTESTLKAGMQDLVRPEDVILVPESLF
jgi:polysaccharide biosynthesis/export protein